MNAAIIAERLLYRRERKDKTLTPAEMCALLGDWKAAQECGVKFKSHYIVFGGETFTVGVTGTRQRGSALKFTERNV